MKKNKNGFTMAEVLICMVIIGVVMVLAMNSIRIVKASYTSLTYFTFKNLKDMVGVVYSGQTAYTDATGVRDASGNKVTSKEDRANIRTSTATAGYEQLVDNYGADIPNPVTTCKYEYDTTNHNFYSLNVLKNDNEFDDTKGVPTCNNRATSGTNENVLFCQAMAGIVNTSGGYTASSTDKRPVRCKKTDMFNVLYSTEKKEPYITNLDQNKPTFVTTNGQRYYMSKWDYNTSVSEKYGYRVLAIDLNGKSNPNKMDTYAPVLSNPPDIVQFLILDNGQVYPLGLAGDNMQHTSGKRVQYITSQVKGYYFDSNSEFTTGRQEENIPEECKKLRTKDYQRDEHGKIIEGASETEVNTCNFSRVAVEKTKGSGDTFYSYREAFCAITPPENVEFLTYCSAQGHSYSKNQYCPPSTEGERFDECRVVNIKPMFRYNFK